MKTYLVTFTVTHQVEFEVEEDTTLQELRSLVREAEDCGIDFEFLEIEEI